MYLPSTRWTIRETKVGKDPKWVVEGHAPGKHYIPIDAYCDSKEEAELLCMQYTMGLKE